MTATAPTPEQTGFLVGHALQALGQHIIDHQLPAPATITIDHQPLDITVGTSGHHQAWLNTVAIDDETNEYRPAYDGRLEPYLVTQWKVRLPDTGVRITLRALRDLPAKVVGL